MGETLPGLSQDSPSNCPGVAQGKTGTSGLMGELWSGAVSGVVGLVVGWLCFIMFILYNKNHWWG